jgi:flagellin-like protein
MRRIFKNKKAVSPVIATVLMILVTMAGMTILFAFVASYSDSYRAGVGGSVLESLTCLGFRWKAEGFCLQFRDNG